MKERILISSIVFGSVLVISFLICLWLASYSLTVTDRRIYGKTTWGKRVDLPIDKISVIGTSILKGISVGTSSGKIKFVLIKNQQKVHAVMSRLLIDRQDKVQKETSLSEANELQKYKNLLDNGTITQEEFNAKKKQLLGL